MKRSGLSSSLQAQLADAMAEFYDDPLGFVMFAFPWDTDESIKQVPLIEPYKTKYGLDYGPDKWAIEYLEYLGEEVKKRKFDGKKPVAPIQISMASGHGVGKLLDDFVPILTSKGWKNHGSLEVGDYVFGMDGKPTRVVQVHDPVYNEECYELEFDCGQKIIAGKEHLWLTRQARGDGPKENVRVKETQEIAQSVHRKNGKAGKISNHSIPVVDGLIRPYKKLPIAPYVLGAWLGDGSNRTGQITNSINDDGIVQSIEKEGYEVNRRKRDRHPKDVVQTVTIYGLTSQLKEEGLLNNKHIPRQYMQASWEQRLALLQGLIDTDGHVAKGTPSVSIDLCHKPLADGVRELILSLGFKVGPERKQPAKLYGRQTGWRYRLNFHPNGLPVARLKRKVANIPLMQDKRIRSHFIKSCKKVPSVPMRCITVEAEDGMYLAGENLIPTHNSAMTSWLTLWIMSTKPFSKGTVTAGTDAQLRTKTWSELARWLNRCITKDWFVYANSRGNMSLRQVDHPNEWFVTAQTCKEENSEAFAGQHAANSVPWYAFDEASAISSKIFEVREGGTTDGMPMVFDFGNPTRNSGRFYDNTVGELSHRYKTFQLDSRDVHITNKKRIQEWVDDYGEDSDFVKVRVRGVFPSFGMAQFISTEAVLESQKAEHFNQDHEALVIGVDVARFGDNKSVIYPRIGKDARSFAPKIISGMDSVQVAGEVIQMIRDFEGMGKQCKAIFVDAGGVGGGVIDQLKYLGYHPIEVYAQHRPRDPNSYRYKADEMWAKMKKAIESGLLLPDNKTSYGKELSRELTQREYTYTLKGQVTLESKKDMKERGLESPDIADALALTYYEEVAPDKSAGIGRNQPKMALSEYDPLEGVGDKNKPYKNPNYDKMYQIMGMNVQ